MKDRKRKARTERVRLERQTPMLTIDGGLTGVGMRVVGKQEHNVAAGAMASLFWIYGPRNGVATMLRWIDLPRAVRP